MKQVSYTFQLPEEQLTALKGALTVLEAAEIPAHQALIDIAQEIVGDSPTTNTEEAEVTIIHDTPKEEPKPRKTSRRKAL